MISRKTTERVTVFQMTAVMLLLNASPVLAEPSLDRGNYLVEGPSACGNCHSPMGPNGPLPDMDFAGMMVEKNENFTAIAPNITPAGRVGDWSDLELAKAIREGLRPDGTIIGPPMPMGLYRGISDDDLMSMVIYLRQIPAVENDPGESVYNIPLPPAYGPPIETVAAIPPSITVEYGAYLAGPIAHCIECHTTFGPQGPMFETHLGAGGFSFHGPWGTSVGSNITPTGIGDYSDAELSVIIQKGLKPDGSPMMPPMPYPYLAKMTDEDLAAVLLYLRALPPLPDGG